MNKTQRKRAKKRLARAPLNVYCQLPGTHWPSGDLLASIEADVATLTSTGRVSWKSFDRLITRLPSLRFVALRVNKLISRAVGILNHPSQKTVEHARPLLHWLVKIDHPRVRELAVANREVAVEVTKQIRRASEAKQQKEREQARLRKQRARKKSRQNTVTQF